MSENGCGAFSSPKFLFTKAHIHTNTHIKQEVVLATFTLYFDTGVSIKYSSDGFIPFKMWCYHGCWLSQTYYIFLFCFFFKTEAFVVVFPSFCYSFFFACYDFDFTLNIKNWCIIYSTDFLLVERQLKFGPPFSFYSYCLKKWFWPYCVHVESQLSCVEKY